MPTPTSIAHGPHAGRGGLHSCLLAAPLALEHEVAFEISCARAPHTSGLQGALVENREFSTSTVAALDLVSLRGRHEIPHTPGEAADEA